MQGKCRDIFIMDYSDHFEWGKNQSKAKTAFTYGIHSCNTHYFAENAQMKQKCPDKDQKKKKKNSTQQTIYSYSSNCQI